MIKVSLKNKLQGHEKVAREIIDQSNQRINTIMKKAVRDFQKKQRISWEKASKILLNA